MTYFISLTPSKSLCMPLEIPLFVHRHIPVQCSSYDIALAGRVCVCVCVCVCVYGDSPPVSLPNLERRGKRSHSSS